MKRLLFTLGTLLLVGLLPACDPHDGPPPREPAPVYRPAARTYTDDLESRVTELEREGQRARDRKNAELFAPQYPQPKLPELQPSYPRTDPLAPPAPRARDLGF